MIEINRLTKSLFGGGHRVDILNGIDLVIPDGQFLAITGPSGSGKTTLLSLIAGLDTPSSGSILIDKQDITQLKEDELALMRGRNFGFVFQNFHLIPTLTALENVALAAELNGSKNDLAKSRDMLTQIGLGDRMSHYPSQMSGGEQQRLSLARAFVNEPAIILADEPTGNLDSKNTERIMDLMRECHRARRTTVVLVTHEQRLAARAERVLTLDDGRIINDSLNELSRA
ncbi:MAG: ABC transporter ATP-binding protein [Nitrospinales bacterium]